MRSACAAEKPHARRHSGTALLGVLTGGLLVRMPCSAIAAAQGHGVPFGKLRAGFRLRLSGASAGQTSLRMTILFWY
jgi:hypothetical protein